MVGVKKTCREPSARRKAVLDPSCYRTLEEFRKAVSDGSVDPLKGCRTMSEYHWSIDHGRLWGLPPWTN